MIRRLLIVLVLTLAGCAPAAPPAPTLTAAPVSNPHASQTPSAAPTDPPPSSTPSPTATPAPTATATQPPPRPRVVIISVDGLRPDALLQVDAPHIQGLARRGAFTWAAQTVFPPVTLPSHASMLSGYEPAVHGILWNDYFPRRGAIGVPTLFSAAAAAGLRTALISGKEKLAHLNAPGTVDVYILAVDGDRDVVDRALEQIQAGVDLLFVHLPNMDFSGHSNGWMSERYLAQLPRADEAVGRLLAALPAETVVILTADHGGRGFAHGANVPEDMTIPWIIAGPGVIPNFEIPTPVRTVDTAATAAYVLGVSLPPEISGQPVYAAFGQAAPDLLGGVWREGAPQSPARSELPAAVLDGLIYVPGGFGGETVFQAYDPAADRWIDLAPLPSGRHHLMAAAVNGQVYVFGGGAAGTWNPTATAWVYDPAANAWREIAPMPEARMAGAAAVLGDKIYIVGGAGGSNALLEYDARVNTWRALAALSQAREHLAAVALRGEIYALGGRWQGAGELSSVEIFDPAAGAWRAGPPLLQPHAGFSAAVLHGRILAGGGEIIFAGRETLAAFEIYDPRAQAWSPGPDLPYPIHGVAAAALDGRYYLLGGSSRAGAIENFGRVMIYTP